MTLVNVTNQLGDDLRISFAFEFVPLVLQILLDVFVIGNNTVVTNDEF